MRPVSATLAAYLDATTASPPIAHLFTFTPRTGSPAYWTDWTADVAYAGHTFKAGGQGTIYPIPHVVKGKQVAGLEIGSYTVVLECGESAMLNGTLIPIAATRRELDGATVAIVRYYPDCTATDPDDRAMALWTGYVGPLRIAGLNVEMEAESGVALLNVQLPKVVFQAGCTHMVYKGECGLDVADWTVTGTVSSGATTTSIPTNASAADGWYDLGVLTFTSGACAGETRAIRSYAHTAGAFTLDRPLPVAPANGDTWSAYPGCNKIKTDADRGCTRFSNTARWRGFRFIPRNEAAL